MYFFLFFPLSTTKNLREREGQRKGGKEGEREIKKSLKGKKKMKDQLETLEPQEQHVVSSLGFLSASLCPRVGAKAKNAKGCKQQQKKSQQKPDLCSQRMKENRKTA